MDRFDSLLAHRLARRRLLSVAGAASGGAALAAATALGPVKLLINGGPRLRPMSNAFTQKGKMIVQRVRPPLLETPFEVFDQGVFTPNDQFYVRWHWGDIPTSVDPGTFRLTIGGAVKKPVNLSLDDLLAMPRTALAAVNQCAGNSRGLFEPRVAGAQWAHGAMGNALWEGVSLKALLERAGVRGEAVAVRFGGLDKPLTDADDFEKSLAIDHALSGEVMVAFAMNGEQLPLLNGFPLRLVVPGWYSTYWIKALNQIEVLSAADDNFWMTKAYKIPTTKGADVAPGTKDFDSVPISTMVARSFITSIGSGATIARGQAFSMSGIAFGGATGVRNVDVSADGGRTWQAARLGPDEGKYSFRRFTLPMVLSQTGQAVLMSRCTASDGAVQPMLPNWNPGGYMRGCVEQVEVTVA